jgi:hypothetical protein
MPMDLQSTQVAVIGLGYVGLPLAVEFGKKYPTIGFDINSARIQALKEGKDSTLEVSAQELSESSKLRFTTITCSIYSHLRVCLNSISLMKLLRYGVSITIFAIIFIGTFFRSSDWFIHDIYWFQQDLGGDKAVHIIMGGLLVIALWLINAMVLRIGSLLLVALLLIIDEVSQLYIPSRTFSMSDLGLSFVGLFIGAGVVAMLSFLYKFGSVRFKALKPVNTSKQLDDK